MDRRDLQRLSRIRIREAKALAKLGLHDGAYYLVGYAVECALKACIAKGTRRHEFPDRKKVEASYKHDLRELVRVADLDDARVDESRRSLRFRNNWDVVKSWSEESRYRTNSASDTRALVEAVTDSNHGVLRWVKQHW